MRRIPAAVAAAAIALAMAPVVLADDGPVTPAADPTPVVEPTAPPVPTATPVENGEIVIDPTFIVATPAPAGQVAAASGRPQPTPPATDTITPAATRSTGLHALLVLGVAGSSLWLAVARGPSRRRR